LQSPEQLGHATEHALSKIGLISAMRVKYVTTVEPLTYLNYLSHQLSSNLRRVEGRFDSHEELGVRAPNKYTIVAGDFVDD